MYRTVAAGFGSEEADSEKGTFERTVCKGEENCEEFQSARGKNREEKEKRVCKAMCRAFGSKISPIPEKNEFFLSALIYRVFELRKELLTGYKPSESRMTHLEFECLKYTVELFESFDRGVRIDTLKTLEHMLKRPIF